MLSKEKKTFLKKTYFFLRRSFIFLLPTFILLHRGGDENSIGDMGLSRRQSRLVRPVRWHCRLRAEVPADIRGHWRNGCLPNGVHAARYQQHPTHSLPWPYYYKISHGKKVSFWMLIEILIVVFPGHYYKVETKIDATVNWSRCSE